MLKNTPFTCFSKIRTLLRVTKIWVALAIPSQSPDFLGILDPRKIRIKRRKIWYWTDKESKKLTVQIWILWRITCFLDSVPSMVFYRLKFCFLGPEAKLVLLGFLTLLSNLNQHFSDLCVACAPTVNAYLSQNLTQNSYSKIFWSK